METKQLQIFKNHQEDNSSKGYLHAVVMPDVLDACCGSRMFWFNKNDTRAIYADKRIETWITDNRKGRSPTVVKPGILFDFQYIPFKNNVFNLVVFDPPHLKNLGKTSRIARKYGELTGDWKTMIRNGFSECFRVLKPGGTLIFKWNEYQILLSEILALTEERPLFGHKTGRQSKTHWMTFMKA